jgi:glycosyltransferase involved in cell wall biosynthesis
MRILQVHTADAGGGAEQMAMMLHRAFLGRGHEATLLVGRNSGSEPGVQEISQRQRWRGEFRFKVALERLLGLQFLYAPGSHQLLEMPSHPPDVVLLHSLHSNSGYFDIGALPALSRRQPTMLYLQDQWTTTGHCAYSLGCERWRTGCGACPSLATYPALARDGTRWNWLRKRWHFGRSRLTVGAPAQWILDCASESPLLREFPQFLIPNAVDLETFHPGSQRESRSRVQLAQDRPVVLFLANQGAASPFKDFPTLAQAFHRVRTKLPECLLVTVGGEPDPATRAALPENVVFRPYSRDRKELADYYRAADLFCHATRADVCPLTVLESTACGTPVVATAIGGVPEIVLDQRTGRLVPLGDSGALAEAILAVLRDDEARRRMSDAAATFGRNFDIEIQADRFLSLFDEQLAVGKGIASPGSPLSIGSDLPTLK